MEGCPRCYHGRWGAPPLTMDIIDNMDIMDSMDGWGRAPNKDRQRTPLARRWLPWTGCRVTAAQRRPW